MTRAPIEQTNKCMFFSIKTALDNKLQTTSHFLWFYKINKKILWPWIIGFKTQFMFIYLGLATVIKG